MLEGKVALITGAGNGIGRATAHRFAAEGANVVVSDINDEAARAVATEIGETSITNHCDTSVEADVVAAIDATIKAFGRIDILVNNAGVGGGVEWDRMIAINLSGVMHGCKHGAEAMAAQRRRRDRQPVVDAGTDQPARRPASTATPPRSTAWWA